MDHLRMLAIFDALSAVLLLLACGVTVGMTGVAVAGLIVAAAQADQLDQLLVVLGPTLGLTGLVGLLLLGMALLCALAAWLLSRGRGRGLQTLLAVLMITSMPFGTALSIYSLWALWFHQPTVARFGEASGRSGGPVLVLALGAAGLGLCAGLGLGLQSILAVLPLDPEGLAARLEPIELRQGERRDPRACGLTERWGPEGCIPLRVEVTDVEIEIPTTRTADGPATLGATLSLPVDAQGLALRSRPAAILMHGSGPATRDGHTPGDLVARYPEPFPMYRELAHALAARGIVTLRWDKRTAPVYGDAAFDPERFSFLHFIEDARDALDVLAAREEVDGQALIVLGHSQGGQLAPHVVGEDDRIVAVGLLAGTTETLGREMLSQLERLAAARRDRGDHLTGWLLPLTSWPIRRCLEPVWEGRHDPEARCLGGVPQRAWAEYEALAATTPQVLADLPVPVFAIQGSCDLNVGPEQIPNMIAARGERPASMYRMYGLDHALSSCVDPQQPVVLAPEALAALDRFLASIPHEASRRSDSPDLERSDG